MKLYILLTATDLDFFSFIIYIFEDFHSITLYTALLNHDVTAMQKEHLSETYYIYTSIQITH